MLIDPLVKLRNVLSLFIFIQMVSILSWAQDTTGTPISPIEDQTCPVNYELTGAENRALKEFDFKLLHVDGAYGKERFEKRLQEVLSRLNPEKKIIDVSPFFMEMALYHIDVKYLEDAVERTIGLAHPAWVTFQREMRSVLIYKKGGDDKDQRRFARITEDLLKAVKNVGPRSSRHFARRNYSTEEAGLQKSRVAAQIATMYTSVERVRYIHNEIARQHREAFRAGLALNLIRIASAGVLIAGTIYAGPIIAVAGTIARVYATDVIVASHLARAAQAAKIAQAGGQAVAGGALGAIGAPAGRLAIDTTRALGRARTESLNNRTSHACELNKQFEIWKSQGVSPYFNAALVGGSIGLGLTGTVYVLPRLGSQVLLSVTSFGVGVAQAYSLGMLSYNTALSLHEYDLAEKALEAGDKELAIEHLHKSREYAQLGGERAIESVLLGVLSVSIGATFKSALIEGREAIATIIANSADTLPVAITVGQDIAETVSASEM